MKDNESGPDLDADNAGFFSRWSQRKQVSRSEASETPQTPAVTETVEPPLPPGDEDMVPLDELNENSDYSGFLSPRVSDALRRVALRKLFHSADFNVCDGLDDYAEDFTSFEKLGDIITADMRFQLEQQARKLVETEPTEAELEAPAEVEPLTDAETEPDSTRVAAADDDQDPHTDEQRA